jgi:Flp pilus assembly protein CpaB
MRQAGFFTPVLRAFRWHRRWFAAIFAAIAVLAGLNAINTAGPDAREVVVAARPIDAGTALAAEDLEMIRLPEQAIPDGALSDPADLIGRTTKAATPGRRVLVEADLLGATAGVGAGRLALPVRFGESQASALLTSGVRIDVLGPQAGSSGYQVVAADVRVITVVAQAASGPFGGSDSGPVLLEVDSGQAAAILASASIGSISFALR